MKVEQILYIENKTKPKKKEVWCSKGKLPINCIISKVENTCCKAKSLIQPSEVIVKEQGKYFFLVPPPLSSLSSLSAPPHGLHTVREYS